MSSPSTSTERFQRLIRALVAGTRSGRVKWRMPSQSTSFFALMTGAANTFEADMTPATVRISAPPGGDEEPRYTLALLNDRGVTLESWSVKRKPESEPGMVETLYNLARDSALQLDDVVDQIVRSSTGE